MQWKQQNSGGGFWVYTGRLVTPDSVAGTVVLTDWPQLPAGQKPPAGTFALARRAPGLTLTRMSLLDDLARELRYAARTFRREPAFVAGIVLTFGLAIGTNAAMFGLVQRLMLAPPPGVRDAERVVRVGMTFARTTVACSP